ncbi:MAG: AMP-binding protein [Planctomycetota bacterium]
MDTFVHDRLPPKELWPELDFSGLPELEAYGERMNCGVELLDKAIDKGFGDRPVLRFGDAIWTYASLLERANKIAQVLTEDLGMQPGNRVLLRAPNNPMAVACWFGIVRAGGVVVATMPLLRAKELCFTIQKADIQFGLCDEQLTEEWQLACDEESRISKRLVFSNGGEGAAELEKLMAQKSGEFTPYDSHAEDPVLIAFTSGTTGDPKGTVHFHRDVMAIGDTFARHIHSIEPDDVFLGSPPLAFTFGLGALVTFPMQFGASTVMVERFGPTTMLETVQSHGVTGLYTSPTGYRAMAQHLQDPSAPKYDLSSLRSGVSAGEHLPEATWQLWKEVTGISLIDGIGATELLHIFISASGDDIRPGSTGKAVPGFQARVVDDEMNDAPIGEPGRLAVKGPTGCRYLEDPDRQAAYVREGWNLTGDVYTKDAEGYFRYVARADDMIISAGYNISGPEVENALLQHDAVAECACIAAPDDERGQIVKACVVLKDGSKVGDDSTRDEMIAELQNFVKATIAPYKYPRAVEFHDSLPKTQTGKLQRFRLRRSDA